MVGTISFVQTAIAQLLFQEMDDPQKAMLASLAWNKLLIVQLDILLAGYVDEVPLQPTVATPEPNPSGVRRLSNNPEMSPRGERGVQRPWEHIPNRHWLLCN